MKYAFDKVLTGHMIKLVSVVGESARKGKMGVEKVWFL